MRVLFTSIACLLAGMAACAHAHSGIYAGATDTNNDTTVGAGDRLSFITGYVPGKVYHLVPHTGSEEYAGLFAFNHNPGSPYPNDPFDFAALSNGQGGFGPSQAGHAASGAQIFLQVTNVTGPAGARFAFWDYEDWEGPGSTPSASFLTGDPTGNYQIQLSQLDAFSNGDPGGYFVDRNFTADKAGDYLITFQLVDRANIHLPSNQPYVFRFQAVPEPASVALLLSGAACWSLGHRRRSPR